ncbi:hypothetical protein [Clostridium sp.]|uniref:hypothetical protein n=1 Tax=Clostridium sp. TaxID=1506 RepID=UPI003D6C8A62
MKILNKKSICLLSALALLVTSFYNVNKVQAIEANPPSGSEITTNIASEVDSIKSEEILTKDQYCERLAKYEHITLIQAEEIVNNRELDSLNGFSNASVIQPLSGPWVVYKQVNWTQTLASADGASCKVTMGCLATVEGYNSFKSIEAVEGEYVLASGSGSFDWVNGNEVAKIINNGDAIYMTCAGTIEGEVSASLEAGFEMAGFTVSGGVSQTITVRKFHTMAKYYYLP